MYQFVLASITASACLFASVIASADSIDTDQSRPVAAHNFATLDRNGDHRISRSEAGFDNALSLSFAEMDVDGDGFVTAAEFAAGEPALNTLSKATHH